MYVRIYCIKYLYSLLLLLLCNPTYICLKMHHYINLYPTYLPFSGFKWEEIWEILSDLYYDKCWPWPVSLKFQLTFCFHVTCFKGKPPPTNELDPHRFYRKWPSKIQMTLTSRYCDEPSFSK